MDALLTCPRCHAFVQPDWPTCKICGFDPSYGGPYGSIYAPKAPPVRPRLLQVIGALATVVLLAAAAYVVGLTLYNQYRYHELSQGRQEVVTIPR
jgi:hypothetical protein